MGRSALAGHDAAGIAAAPSARRRVKAPHTRRNDLLDSAQRLFLDQGVATTSVDDIVAGARVAKGTFYLYFGSKEALLLALRERFVDTFLHKLRADMQARPAGDWRGRLRVWVESAFEVHLDNMALHDVVFHEFLPVDRRSIHDNIVIRELIVFIEAGAQAGAWHCAHARMAAVALFSTMHGLADDATVLGYAEDRQALIEAAAGLAERMLDCSGPR